MKNYKLKPILAGAVTMLAASSAMAQERVGAVSIFSLANEFLASEAKLATASLEKMGWKALPIVEAQTSVEQQVTDINNLIAAGVTGIIIDPADSAGIVPALNAAEAAGVKVVLMDVGASGGKAYMTVRIDNAEAGGVACMQMGKLLTEAGKGSGTVLELQGIMAQQAGQQRSSGFHDCMKANFPGLKIVSQPTDWDPSKAADAVQTVLASQTIDAIYMHSDCALLSGVMSSLKQAGALVPVGEANHIVTGAIDGCPAALDSIRAGNLDFTVEQPLVQYGELSAKYLDDAVNGVTYQVGEIEGNGKIVETVTGLEHILPAVLITKDNVEDPNNWGNAAK
jgi:ribose transport system substrate-binding protein